MAVYTYIERYEPRPCLCVFVARFDRRIFLLFVKNGFMGAFAEGNSAPETNPPAVALTPRSNSTSCYYEYAIVSVAWMTKELYNTVQRGKHTYTVYIELNGGM